MIRVGFDKNDYQMRLIECNPTLSVYLALVYKLNFLLLTKKTRYIVSKRTLNSLTLIYS